MTFEQLSSSFPPPFLLRPVFDHSSESSGIVFDGSPYTDRTEEYSDTLLNISIGIRGTRNHGGGGGGGKEELRGNVRFGTVLEGPVGDC